MRRRLFLARLAACGLLLAGLGAGAVPPLWSAAQEVCPECGAPREPGAAFCGRCGHKFAAAAPAENGASPQGYSVVQVVTAHDRELTSTFGSIVFESNLRVDSILGSAFAVAPGEFMTDCGLLSGAKEITLRNPAGRSVPARVVGIDPMIGVALLRADMPDARALRLREDTRTRVGEAVTALGYPSVLQVRGDPVMSTGVVSGLDRGGSRIHPIEDYLQTDASLPRGLAGGPWLAPGGSVVGMSTGLVLGARVFLGPQSGIGYAIPSVWLARALSYIRAGAPPRGWIGAYTEAADFESRARYDLPTAVRLVVELVFPDSPSAGAGLQRGDGLLRVDGQEVTTLANLHEQLLGKTPGDRVELEIARRAEQRTLSLELTPRPDRPRLTGLDALRYFGDLELGPRKEDGRIVLSFVTPGSEAAHLKLAAGDLLQSVLSKKDWAHGAKDNARWRSVRSVADLEERLQTAYSDLDFALGLRFRSRAGTRRELYVWEILTPTGAL
jgi:S1-C subfamily serine protease